MGTAPARSGCFLDCDEYPSCACGVADESGYRRVRMPLSEGHMDVSLSPDASPEAVEMLHRVGEAVLREMKEESDA
jgi:hypothetical protein